MPVDRITIPDRITPIRAWRAWAITPIPSPYRETPLNTTDWRLRSVVVPVAWPVADVFTAACAACPGLSPSIGCTCGIHALKSLDRLLDYLRALQGWWSIVAIGPVSLWGTVIEHEHGYRAEHAAVAGPLQIYADPRLASAALAIRTTIGPAYNVPVEIIPYALEADANTVFATP